MEVPMLVLWSPIDPKPYNLGVLLTSLILGPPAPNAEDHKPKTLAATLSFLKSHVANSIDRGGPPYGPQYTINLIVGPPKKELRILGNSHLSTL